MSGKVNRLFIQSILLYVFASLTVLAKPVSSADVVKVEFRSSTDKINAGSIARFAVLISINKGWHVNSYMPVSDELITTKIDLVTKEGIILINTQYPKGKSVKFSFTNKPLDVYEGNVIIFFSVRFSEHFKLGTDTLGAVLTVQACDDRVCLAPSEIYLKIPIQVVGKEEKVTEINQEIFSSYTEKDFVVTQKENPIEDMFNRKGSLLAFLAIFALGLALNLTPCVYPMLSVTVSLFGSQSDQALIRIFIKSVIYVLGIATMYSILGVTAALSGGLFGGWLQSPWVLAGIAFLLFLLALSSFGLYHIQLPFWLTSRIDISKGSGFIALYLSGLVVGIFAAPCAGPPVIALLTFVATTRNVTLGFWIFFIFALGLGLPYLILGTFSGLLKKIPKSGSWLVWIEHIFGVILIGAGLFYLLLAISPKDVIYVVPITLVAGGVFLGFIDSAGNEQALLRKIKWVFGIVVVLIGILQASSLKRESIKWEKYSDSAYEEAVENGMPVLIDFYADWCIPCIELDQNTWTDPEVINATKDMLRLKVDLTVFDSRESEAIRKKFNISGVPTIVFIRPDGTEAIDSRIVGYVSPKEFIGYLKQAMSQN